jgi:acetyl esterase/lipase
MVMSHDRALYERFKIRVAAAIDAGIDLLRTPWTRQHNQFGWSCLRGKQKIDADRIHHFSPSLAKNVAGLPRCYMATGSLDLFLEENIEYALHLVRAGIAVELDLNLALVGERLGTRTAGGTPVELSSSAISTIMRG